MSDQHGTYYVPESSKWPIIGAIGLFCFALGSLNFTSLFGSIIFFIGALTLIGMLFGWLSNVVSESGKGLYDTQMHRTFSWGMFWFLFCETFFFGTPTAALIYTRISTIPWLSGNANGGSLMTHLILWPNFSAEWPLLTNPNPNAFSIIHNAPAAFGVPLINTLLIVASALLAIVALKAFKRGFRVGALINLTVAILLGILFFALQLNFIHTLMTHYGVTSNSGIYGSLLFMLYGFHTIHVFVGLLILAVVMLLIFKRHFTPHQTFGFAAAVWFWGFITVAWLVIFTAIYWV